MISCEQLVKNAAKSAGNDLVEGRALWQIGATLLEAGHWREAEPPLTQSLAILDKYLGTFHLDVARVCNSLAIVHYKVSQHLLDRSSYCWSGHVWRCTMYGDTCLKKV